MVAKTSLEEWFEEQQKTLAIEVEEIPLVDAHDWVIVEKDGKSNHIGHISQRFHRGVFLKSWEAVRGDWVERFMIAPISSSSTGVGDYGVALLARCNGRFLVQAKAEPGNGAPGHVVLTTTVQASHLNIEAGLSGKVQFTDFYKDEKCKRFMVPQDGAQMYMKVNQVCFLDLITPPIEIPKNFTWATAEEIFSLAKNGLVSEHIIQCLGISVLSES